MKTLDRSSLGLVEATRDLRLDGRENLLVVVDQFEELFRYRQLGSTKQEYVSGISEDAIAFVNLLLEVRDQATCPVYVMNPSNVSGYWTMRLDGTTVTKVKAP